MKILVFLASGVALLALGPLQIVPIGVLLWSAYATSGSTQGLIG